MIPFSYLLNRAKLTYMLEIKLQVILGVGIGMSGMKRTLSELLKMLWFCVFYVFLTSSQKCSLGEIP